MRKNNIIIIGVGGIGSNLAEFISRFLNFEKEFCGKIVLIDGDSFEEKNKTRQSFIRYGNKAESKVLELIQKFTEIPFVFHDVYINKKNVSEYILDDAVVFLCVDNHKTRKIISDHCNTLNNITIINGGNDLLDGSVHLYVRENGKDITPSLTKYNPEIETPEDETPEEMSCEKRSISEPQIFFTNLQAAIIMCQVYYSLYTDTKTKNLPSIIYFDIATQKVTPSFRK
ncbi:MAG: thiamine biosynthesis protein ThiF [candidate division CPR1 bacterium ADurb.Bin160]|uniref:Thiamine biosynthesis protein ThiF n=1 Tax=candidate division CPR1 bacterium ADurb.Bin160 TaxID=1852826 RepID=A0A1V5ZNQ5_9BACT|nr:MAG: thiamine biosynthesis protein ThiF [candidate division CPR1 bacterium ADurb.Bin160]